ncbi:hypothetical protein OVA07_09505 [Novosphingobium sp. SL115]|uniref:hypothetical protein n=1 Tax=Novosphingobium sp. SL115 TaxID=2995150 RepID=UPI0022761145|nr:hypothetical protein [Novosphingobium sp. SL115]MCY1671247.1 hypothetical protein [Novosphingobium sp. SL115]
MRRYGAIAATLAAVILLAGCVLLPGKFVSDIALRKDGSFDFSYKGDIHVLALSKMAANERNKDTADATFEPSTCYNDETGEERTCTDDELAEQKQVWDDEQVANKAAAQERKASEEKMMKTMFGGLDPSDPRAAQEFAERLRRQKGWKSVIDKGDGRFEVEFAIAGRLDHDFTFPTIEKFPMVAPFVTIIRRVDGSVRVEAPAFASNASNSPLMGMAAAVADEKSGRNGGDSQPVLDGVLTLVSDGEILANNTDDGPVSSPLGRKLEWKVNARTTAAPTALIKIAH